MSSRLIVESEPRTGVWNMAFDEALLEAASRRGESILRLYRWSEPTLSLGYFQRSVPPELPRPLLSLPRVRRLSGGGAILHHFEWTYSCAIPRTHPYAKNTERLYEVVHGALICALGSLHVKACLRGGNTNAEAFLCFLRGDARDVIVGKQKVAGSAQRRRRVPYCSMEACFSSAPISRPPSQVSSISLQTWCLTRGSAQRNLCPHSRQHYSANRLRKTCIQMISKWR